jgi:signal transduction histidine kinase
MLGTAADEIAVGLQNALHFYEIQQFNETLQTRVTRATSELKHTNRRLRELDSTKDDFISMASHQLRTPLTSVKGYLSMVLDGDVGSLNSSQEKLLGQAFRSSQQMVYLISDLLNLSRLNTGKFVIEPSEVDLSAIAQSEVEQLTETAKARGVTLVYEKPDSFPMLMLDETKIHQVIMNFIDNAIYYTRPGGTVTVSLHETPSAVEYTVQDNGIGVPKKVQHKLFAKFYRAENAQKARPDGTGLGLFMAKKVIVAQGGSIIFESEEGVGSTFGFRFGKAGHLVSGITPQEKHKQHTS